MHDFIGVAKRYDLLRRYAYVCFAVTDVGQDIADKINWPSFPV